MVRIYKLTVMVIDDNELGDEEITDAIQETWYPNHCIMPSVMSVESREIGEWDDDNPLNNSDTHEEEFRRIFDKTTTTTEKEQ